MQTQMVRGLQQKARVYLSLLESLLRSDTYYMRLNSFQYLRKNKIKHTGCCTTTCVP